MHYKTMKQDVDHSFGIYLELSGPSSTAGE